VRDIEEPEDAKGLEDAKEPKETKEQEMACVTPLQFA